MNIPVLQWLGFLFPFLIILIGLSVATGKVLTRLDTTSTRLDDYIKTNNKIVNNLGEIIKQIYADRANDRERLARLEEHNKK